MMHHCRQTQERLVDLVFDEVPGEAQRRVLDEIASCRDCQEQYRAMTETLVIFDRAAEVSMPEENYWLGHQARLRANLAQDNQVGWWWPVRAWLARDFKKKKFVVPPSGGSLGGRKFRLKPGLRTKHFLAGYSFQMLSGWRLPITASLALIILATLIWFGWRQHNKAAIDTPLVKNIQEPADKSQLKGSVSKAATLPTPEPINKNEIVIRKPKPKLPLNETRQMAQARIKLPVVVPFLNSETIKYFEQTQLLMRSFKNARLSEREGTFDLAYEKRQARSLLEQHRRLQRDAAETSNLPVEELLSSLEPLLLDLANLADDPKPDDVNTIKEYLREKEIIAKLQVYLTPLGLVSSSKAFFIDRQGHMRWR